MKKTVTESNLKEAPEGADPAYDAGVLVRPELRLLEAADLDRVAAAGRKPGASSGTGVKE